MNTNVEPVLKVIASIVLLCSPEKKKKKRQHCEQMFRLINAAAAVGWNSREGGLCPITVSCPSTDQTRPSATHHSSANTGRSGQILFTLLHVHKHELTTSSTTGSTGSGIWSNQFKL